MSNGVVLSSADSQASILSHGLPGVPNKTSIKPAWGCGIEL